MNALFENGRTSFLLFGVLFSLLAGAIVMLVFLFADVNRVKANYNMLLEYLGDGESRDILRELADTIRNIEQDGHTRDRDISRIYNILAACVQKVGVVRYNAFRNVGSDQSFSVALLDVNDDGIVFSGIYGRDSSTSYAKPISGGVSEYVLTEEEKDAIGLARKRYAETTTK